MSPVASLTQMGRWSWFISIRPSEDSLAVSYEFAVIGTKKHAKRVARRYMRRMIRRELLSQNPTTLEGQS